MINDMCSEINPVRRLSAGMADFMVEELPSIFEGTAPSTPLETYIEEAFSDSAINPIELKRITADGVQIWERIAPEDDHERSDFVMQNTDSDYTTLAHRSVAEHFGITGIDTQSEVRSKTFRPQGLFGKVALTVVAGFFLATTFAGGLAGCTKYEKDAGSAKAVAAGVAKAGNVSAGTGDAVVRRDGSDDPTARAGVRNTPRLDAGNDLPPTGNDDSPKTNSLELRVNMHVDSTRFIDNNTVKYFTEFIIEADKQDYTNIGVAGFASIEDARDKANPQKDYHPYNQGLSERRAYKVVNLLLRIARALKRKGKIKNDMEFFNAGYGETDVFGGGLPENRTVTMRAAKTADAAKIGDPENDSTLAATLKLYEAGKMHRTGYIADTPPSRPAEADKPADKTVKNPDAGAPADKPYDSGAAKRAQLDAKKGHGPAVQPPTPRSDNKVTTRKRTKKREPSKKRRVQPQTPPKQWKPGDVIQTPDGKKIYWKRAPQVTADNLTDRLGGADQYAAAALDDTYTSQGASYAEVLNAYTSTSADRVNVAELRKSYGLDEVLANCPEYKGARSMADADYRAARRELSYNARHDEGLTARQIAGKLGVSLSTVYRDLKAYKQELKQKESVERLAA